MDATRSVREILKMPDLTHAWLLEAFTVFTNARLDQPALWVELVAAWTRLDTIHTPKKEAAP